MLGSGEVGSAQANPLKSNPSAPGRLMQWLQSASAEVWVKFLLALVGLGLAFATALFSTVSRDAGNLWATVILASTSLLLATLVGLVTVPYLARRVAVERLRESFDYDVTRAGIVYVIVTLVIGIAALNTGNNLLYIVVAARAGGDSGVWNRFRLGIALAGTRCAPARACFRWTPRAGAHRVAQPSASPALVLHPCDFNAEEEKEAGQAVAVGSHHIRRFRSIASKDQQWLRLPDRRLRRVIVLPPPPGIFQGMAYFPFLPPQGEVSADLELRFDQRGRNTRKNSLSRSTGFPFAVPPPDPARLSLPRGGAGLLSAHRGATDEVLEVLPLVRGEWESFVRGRGSDLYMIREYQPEDSARHVDWKATAKSGSLKVREFAREDEQPVMPFPLNNPEPGLISERAYEKAVDLTASLAWHFSTQEAQVSFVVPGRSRTRDIHEFLAWLAVIEPGISRIRNPFPLRIVRRAVRWSMPCVK